MRIRKRLLFYIVLLFITLADVEGQEYHYKNFTSDHGLPSSETFHVIQDKKGFIWIATNQGVSRFNGYEFENFDIQDGLPENTILEIFEDEIGRIWFVSINGNLSWFENDSIFLYPYNDRIQKSKEFNTGPPMKRSFFIDSTNNLYMSFSRDTLITINKTGNINNVTTSEGNKYQLIKVMPNEEVVFSSYRKPSKGVRLEKKLFLDGIEFVDDSISILVKESIQYRTRFLACKLDSGFLIANGDKLYQIVNNKLHAKCNVGNEIAWISNTDDLIWVGLLNGGAKAFKGDINTTTVELLKDYSVTSVMKDYEGCYWVSTLEKGIFYFPNLNIKNIRELDSQQIELVDNVLENNDEIIFVGNSNKLFSLGINNYEMKIKLPEKKIDKFALLEIVGDTIVYSFYSNVQNGTKILYQDQVFLSCSLVVSSIVKIGEKVFGGKKSIHRLFNPYSTNFFSEYYSRVYDLMLDSNEAILHATDNGLFSFNLITKEITPINHSPLLRTRMNQINRDKQNNDIVWIGSKGEGLLRMKGNNVSQISIKDGLLGNSVNHIEQKDSVLWLATNKGIAKVYLNKESDFVYSNDSTSVLLETYTRANGLLNNEVHDIALNDENVYAGTNNGLAVFSQDLSGINKTSPPIYITNVKVMGRDTTLMNDYKLKHDQNYLEFSYVGLSYQREINLTYKYKLDGVDNNWIETEDRTVRYPMLQPGEYTFKVKAYNRSGVESETVQTIQITINKAYYQTWWFKIGIALFSFLLIGIFYAYIFRVRMQELKKRNAVVDELNKFRQRALSAQMNPHFIYNSLNSVQSFILKNDRENSSTYLSKFGRLMRRILENSQYPLITLSEELDALKAYIEMEQLRFKEDFNFKLNIDKDIIIEKINVPPLIIQPYVENAIHHGLRLKKGTKNLNIQVLKLENRICIRIEDNGIGRKESLRIRQQSGNTEKSYGTEITDKRLSLFKEIYKNDVDIKIIDIEEAEEKGTIVQIFINE